MTETTKIEELMNQTKFGNNKTIYIAGKVTGLPLETAFQIFHEKEMELTAKGYNVINPLFIINAINRHLHDRNIKQLEDVYTLDREAIMGLCKRLIVRADEIFLLDNWTDSKGAIDELAFAKLHEIKIRVKS